MKVLHCSDAGFDCTGVTRDNTDEEILAQASEHALKVHNVMVTEVLAGQLKTLIKEKKEEDL